MCQPRHRHAVEHPAAPAAPARDDPSLRASDDERESAVGLLREHGALGRIDVEELERRVGAAYAARTRGELTTLLADLPGELPARARTAAPARGHEWSAFLQVSVVLVAIWALSGAGYFWPAWVVVWWAAALVMKSAPRRLRLR
jgi:hypothetical protein